MLKLKDCIHSIDLLLFVSLFIIVIFTITGIFIQDRNVSSITLYDYSGHVIKQWEGNFELYNDKYQFYFDFEDKKVIVHGGILIAQ